MAHLVQAYGWFRRKQRRRLTNLLDCVWRRFRTYYSLRHADRRCSLGRPAWPHLELRACQRRSPAGLLSRAAGSAGKAAFAIFSDLPVCDAGPDCASRRAGSLYRFCRLDRRGKLCLGKGRRQSVGARRLRDRGVGLGSDLRRRDGWQMARLPLERRSRLARRPGSPEGRQGPAEPDPQRAQIEVHSEISVARLPLRSGGGVRRRDRHQREDGCAVEEKRNRCRKEKRFSHASFSACGYFQSLSLKARPGPCTARHAQRAFSASVAPVGCARSETRP